MQELLPAIIDNGFAQTLEPVSQKDYDEDYIQNLIFVNPNLLKLNEIDISCGTVIPLCREFPVDMSGHAIDDLYVDSNGVVTIAECKLIRNHQATREVLGQILDYAKEVVKFDYKELDKRVRKITKKSITEIVLQYVGDLDCDTFAENLARNLKEGRINLVITGDRISKNVEDLVTFLNGYAKMSFKLGVVEIQLYRLPASEKIIAIPNCMFKTVEYKLYRIDEGSRQVEELKQENNIDLFYDRLKKNTGITELKEFIDSICYNYHLVTVIGRGETISLNVKTEDESVNLVSITDKGIVSFYGLAHKALSESMQKIGNEYINAVCSVVKAEPNFSTGGWGTYPKIKDRRLSIKTLLKYKKIWESFIECYVKEYEKIKSSL